MFSSDSIRGKLIFTMIVVASLALLTATFGAWMINRLSYTAETVLERYVPYSRCCEQALLTVAENSVILNKLRLLRPGAPEEPFRELESQLQRNTNRFDMFMKAMIWGSESEPFSRAKGGLLLSQWEAERWQKQMTVVQAPDPIRHAAGVASLYYGAFVKYARRVIDDQRRLAAAETDLQTEQVERLRQQLDEDFKHADRFARLANNTLEETVASIHAQLALAMNQVRETQSFAKRALAAFASATFVVSILLGLAFANRTILRPLRRLRQGVRVVGGGNLDFQIPVRGDDEIAQLSRAFNQMTASLKEITASRDELQRARDAAEAASRAKTAFLANMSHEMRTPLNAVLGMTELLLDSDVSAEQAEYLRTIQRSGETLLRLINDVLDISRIEAGRLTLEELPFEPAEVVGDLMKSFAVAAQRKGLELAYYWPPHVPRWLVGDPQRLSQVLSNLLDNAIKFTDQGEVTLNVDLAKSGEDEVVLEFTVTDTGPGIPANMQQKIFDKFEQVDSSMRRKHGGAGLGLAIAAGLVERMAGKLTVDSQPGRGSTFRFSVTLKRAAEVQTSEPLVSSVDAALFVAEPHTLTRRFLVDTFQSWNARTTQAGSPEEIEQVLQQLPPGTRFDVLVLDERLLQPLSSETRQRLAEALAPDGRTVVLLSTLDQPPPAPTDFAPLTASRWLHLPVKLSELYEVVAPTTGDTPHRPATERAAGRPSLGQPLRVLLAEDSLVNQKLAVSLLQKQGHEVTVVASGKEAVEAATTQQFDVILMDVQMPEMDGFEATAAIRRHEAATGRRTPIVAMTAHALKGDREKCLAAGMDAYIAKPIRSDELFALLATLSGQAPPENASDDTQT